VLPWVCVPKVALRVFLSRIVEAMLTLFTPNYNGNLVATRTQRNYSFVCLHSKKEAKVKSMPAPLCLFVCLVGAMNTKKKEEKRPT
jgi:hypothetical protein